MTARDMTMNPSADQQWTRIELLGDLREGETTGDAMTRQGWEPWVRVGGYFGDCQIQTWRRDENGIWRYALAIGDWQDISELVAIPDIVSLMNLLAAWGPVAQAASICQVVDDLTEGSIDTEGTVETVAARAEWGRTEGLHRLRLQTDAAPSEPETETATVAQQRSGDDHPVETTA